MQTFESIGDILHTCKFNDWQIVLALDDHNDNPFLQVRFLARCNKSRHAYHTLCKGRKWRLSYHMTKSEIVQTAFKAVLAAVEHETREQFLYRGAAIFGPHYDVDHLHDICSVLEYRDEREEV